MVTKTESYRRLERGEWSGMVLQQSLVKATQGENQKQTRKQ